MATNKVATAPVFQLWGSEAILDTSQALTVLDAWSHPAMRSESSYVIPKKRARSLTQKDVFMLFDLKGSKESTKKAKTHRRSREASGRTTKLRKPAKAKIKDSQRKRVSCINSEQLSAGIAKSMKKMGPQRGLVSVANGGHNIQRPTARKGVGRGALKNVETRILLGGWRPSSKKTAKHRSKIKAKVQANLTALTFLVCACTKSTAVDLVKRARLLKKLETWMNAWYKDKNPAVLQFGSTASNLGLNCSDLGK
jgi:hypothetical protein